MQSIIILALFTVALAANRWEYTFPVGCTTVGHDTNRLLPSYNVLYLTSVFLLCYDNTTSQSFNKMLTIESLSGNATTNFLVDVPRVIAKGDYPISYSTIISPTVDGLAAIQIKPPPKEGESSVVWNMFFEDGYGVTDLTVFRSNQDIVIAKYKVSDTEYNAFGLSYPEKKLLWSKRVSDISNMLFYPNAENLYVSVYRNNATTIGFSMSNIYNGKQRYNFFIVGADQITGPYTLVNNPAHPEFWQFSAINTTTNSAVIFAIDSRFRHSFSSINVEKIYADGSTRCDNPIFSEKGDTMLISCTHTSRDGKSTVGTVQNWNQGLDKKILWAKTFENAQCQNMISSKYDNGFVVYCGKDLIRYDALGKEINRFTVGENGRYVGFRDITANFVFCGMKDATRSWCFMMEK